MVESARMGCYGPWRAKCGPPQVGGIFFLLKTLGSVFFWFSLLPVFLGVIKLPSFFGGGDQTIQKIGISLTMVHCLG